MGFVKKSRPKKTSSIELIIAFSILALSLIIGGFITNKNLFFSTNTRSKATLDYNTYVNWEFDGTDTEGWTGTKFTNLNVSNGLLEGTVVGVRSYPGLTHQETISLEQGNKMFQITLKVTIPVGSPYYNDGRPWSFRSLVRYETSTGGTNRVTQLDYITGQIDGQMRTLYAKMPEIGSVDISNLIVEFTNPPPNSIVTVDSMRIIDNIPTISTPTPAPTSTLTPTSTPTSTLTPTSTPTSTLTPTSTPTSTLTPTPSRTPTPTPSRTPTPTPSRTPTPTPTGALTPTPIPITFGTCNSLCLTNSNCSGGLVCNWLQCRNPACPSDSSCSCTPTPTPTPTLVPTPTPLASCGNFCWGNSGCSNGLICSGNHCRNSLCTQDTTCMCITPTPPPGLIPFPPLQPIVEPTFNMFEHFHCNGLSGGDIISQNNLNNYNFHWNVNNNLMPDCWSSYDSPSLEHGMRYLMNGISNAYSYRIDDTGVLRQTINRRAYWYRLYFVVTNPRPVGTPARDIRVRLIFTNKDTHENNFIDLGALTTAGCYNNPECRFQGAGLGCQGRPSGCYEFQGGLALGTSHFIDFKYLIPPSSRPHNMATIEFFVPPSNSNTPVYFQQVRLEGR